jgi:hypothetical protein
MISAIERLESRAAPRMIFSSADQARGTRQRHDGP